MNHVIGYKCPNCYGILPADIEVAGLFACPSCHKNSYFSNVTNDCIATRIAPFSAQIDAFKIKCFNYLMDNGSKNIFRNIKNIKYKQVYIPIFEAGSISKRFAVNMLDRTYDEVVSNLFDNNTIAYDSYSAIFVPSKFEPLSMDHINDERHKPVLCKKELLNPTATERVIRHMHNIEIDAICTIKFLPIFICEFTYNSNNYQIKCYGDEDLSNLKTDFKDDSIYVDSKPTKSPIGDKFNFNGDKNTHNVEDEQSAKESKIMSVLKKGGKAILSVFNVIFLAVVFAIILGIVYSVFLAIFNPEYLMEIVSKVVPHINWRVIGNVVVQIILGFIGIVIMGYVLYYVLLVIFVGGGVLLFGIVGCIEPFLSFVLSSRYKVIQKRRRKEGERLFM